jgi:phospholipase C
MTNTNSRDPRVNMHIRRAVRFALLPIALSASMGVHAANAPATPITNVIVLFQENVSFDHYFGTYPKALNNSGETQFSAYPGTPSVNGLSPARRRTRRV